MSHKEGCIWDDVYFSEYVSNPNGADTQLTITEEGLTHYANAHMPCKEDVYITFNYCPVCGEEI